MEMFVATIEHNIVEDHVLDIMDDILNVETKLWHKKFESTKNFITEKSIICMCQVAKQTKNEGFSANSEVFSSIGE